MSGRIQAVQAPGLTTPIETGLLRVGRMGPGLYIDGATAKRQARTIRWLMRRVGQEPVSREMRVIHTTALEELLTLLESVESSQQARSKEAA